MGLVQRKNALYASVSPHRLHPHCAPRRHRHQHHHRGQICSNAAAIALLLACVPQYAIDAMFVGHVCGWSHAIVYLAASTTPLYKSIGICVRLGSRDVVVLCPLWGCVRLQFHMVAAVFPVVFVVVVCWTVACACYSCCFHWLCQCQWFACRRCHRRRHHLQL